MKDISKIVNKDLFINSYDILKNYVEDRGDAVKDINLILITEYLRNLSHKEVGEFYDKYIQTGLVYSLPEFFSSDLVTIPKSIADVREYRFFSCFSMILYNAVGIFFAEACSLMIRNLDLEERGIYSYSPTKYNLREEGMWVVNNKWQKEYSKYREKIIEKTNEADVVLGIDVSNFFNSIKHHKLIEVIDDFISAPIRKKYSFDGASQDTLAYYFLSMMGDRKGLPQGRKNFASDYLACLYMSKFDMELEGLVSSSELKFVSVIRYVDDIHIFFKNPENKTIPDIYKELGKIEHKISKWLYKNLGLAINNNKTLRKIILQKQQKDNFIVKIQKRTSGLPGRGASKSKIEKKVEAFGKALAVFSYPQGVEFRDNLLSPENRENLKHIFDPSVKIKLAHKSEVVKITKILSGIDFELSAPEFNIIGALFEIEKSRNKLYSPILLEYLNKNFDPIDKRHIHIVLIMSVIVSSKSTFSSLVKKNKDFLLKDDYGKYLVAYYFPGEIAQPNSTNQWVIEGRVFERICLEKQNRFKTFPFIQKLNPHAFNKILLLDKKVSHLDSVYTALCGYIHEFTFERWSVAFNKLQMVTHETIKYFFKEIKDIDKGKDIIRVLNKQGLNISTYEERDFLNFWERRNFNPASHGSKNGLTSPEVTCEELIKWEKKIAKIIDKIILLKR